MPWMLITCGRCGQSADIDRFTRTPIGGALPQNTFQCPACGCAFERRAAGPGRRYDSGLYVPGPVEVVRVETRL